MGYGARELPSRHAAGIEQGHALPVVRFMLVAEGQRSSACAAGRFPPRWPTRRPLNAASGPPGFRVRRSTPTWIVFSVTLRTSAPGAMTTGGSAQASRIRRALPGSEEPDIMRAGNVPHHKKSPHPRLRAAAGESAGSHEGSDFCKRERPRAPGPGSGSRVAFGARKVPASGSTAGWQPPLRV